MPDPLAQLIAERDITRRFHTYFERVDANDPNGASLSMAPDVEFEIMIGERRAGRERFARGLGRVLDGYTATSHHVTNLLVEVDESGDTAHASMYVYAFHRMANTGEPWHLWARIDDRLQQIDGEWLISEHLVLGMDAVPMRPDIPRSWYVPHAGRLDRS
jgi:ketosteroid isomerase-like protein